MVKRFAVVVVLGCIVAACGVTLPPIIVTLPAPGQQPAPEPAPVPPPAPTPPPAVEPTPVEPAPPPVLVNLNIVVLNAAALPIHRARVSMIGERARQTDGAGFVNFAVTGSSLVDISAPGYIPKQLELPPGDHRVHLEAIAPPPAPEPALPPGPPAAAPACGARANPTEHRIECARAIAASSTHWQACTARGDELACHHYARAVATALAAGEPHHGWGWGLIAKPRGQQQCSLTECGGDVAGQGYAEDAIAYLPDGAPTTDWIGFDIVGGAGAPGASVNWNGPLPRRGDNLWAPIP